MCPSQLSRKKYLRGTTGSSFFETFSIRSRGLHEWWLPTIFSQRWRTRGIFQNKTWRMTLLEPLKCMLLLSCLKDVVDVFLESVFFYLLGWRDESRYSIRPLGGMTPLWLNIHCFLSLHLWAQFSQDVLLIRHLLFCSIHRPGMFPRFTVMYVPIAPLLFFGRWLFFSCFRWAVIFEDKQRSQPVGRRLI